MAHEYNVLNAKSQNDLRSTSETSHSWHTSTAATEASQEVQRKEYGASNTTQEQALLGVGAWVEGDLGGDPRYLQYDMSSDLGR